MGVTSFLLVSCLGLTITIQVLACYPPPSIRYGSYSPKSNNYIDGDIVQYRCDKGYALRGSKIRTCSSYGTFEPDAPTCVSDASSTKPWAIAVGVLVGIAVVVLIIVCIRKKRGTHIAVKEVANEEGAELSGKRDNPVASMLS
ncbi:complement component receptor 1-like protein isoform X2 [Larimichthys crocea]|uniref:complement component receptor 1-like protein isoform X2 n=1 Tax=Larimichthys crocea TaxID=215358 RepID=UPI000F5DA741|nr:complement component receptor 1-like protein isoform X2 [Larimichthys crocea]XP_027144549.1 complement component receptor 1-like protein isoform X2 [Larimichthys crocea]